MLHKFLDDDILNKIFGYLEEKHSASDFVGFNWGVR